MHIDSVSMLILMIRCAAIKNDIYNFGQVAVKLVAASATIEKRYG